MRILALDYGSKTVGLAITDALGYTVLPYKTLWREREGKLRKTVREISKVVLEENVEEVVLGLPLNMDGSRGERAEKAEVFYDLLKKNLSCPVVFFDERLSTVEAKAILDENGVPLNKQKEVLLYLARLYVEEVEMEGGRIRLQSDDGNWELEILEETVVSGINYILVTDAPEGEDGTCYVMKDISAPEDEEADYVFSEGDEAERIMDVFAKLLEGEDISIER